MAFGIFHKMCGLTSASTSFASLFSRSCLNAFRNWAAWQTVWSISSMAPYRNISAFSLFANSQKLKFLLENTLLCRGSCKHCICYAPRFFENKFPGKVLVMMKITVLHLPILLRHAKKYTISLFNISII